MSRNFRKTITERNDATAPIVLPEDEFYSTNLLGKQVEIMGVRLAQHRLPPADREFSPLKSHLITWNFGEPGDLIRVETGRSQRTLMTRGAMTLTPAEQPRHWCWNHDTDVLLLQLHPHFISQVAIACEIDISQINLVDRFGIYDPQMEFIGKSLLQEIQSKGLGGKLYTESLINLLAVHLLREHSTLKRPLPKDANQLSPSRLKQVLEYIHENLGQSLSLTELANIANLSPSRFTRVFRQEMGLSPHQYLIQARIEQAKHLLRSRGNVSISRIAHQVGFSDHSHFTRHFKRIVGVTPKEVLQDSRNILNHSPNIQDREI
jgi:AraC family transcriptional regulator